MARGHRLNTSIVLAAVHGLSGLFRAVSAVESSLFRPPPPPPLLSPSLISHLTSVDVKQHGQGHLVAPQQSGSNSMTIAACTSQYQNRLHKYSYLCSVSVKIKFPNTAYSRLNSREKVLHNYACIHAQEGKPRRTQILHRFGL